MNKRWLVLVVALLGVVIVVGRSQGAGTEQPNAPQSDSWNVELIGQIGGPSYAVAVQGDYVYLGVGRGS